MRLFGIEGPGEVHKEEYNASAGFLEVLVLVDSLELCQDGVVWCPTYGRGSLWAAIWSHNSLSTTLSAHLNGTAIEATDL